MMAITCSNEANITHAANYGDCVDMFYVEGNGTRQNICGANADVILITARINYAPIMKRRKEEKTRS